MRLTGSTSITGCGAMTALSSLCVSFPDALITTLTSIPLRRSNFITDMRRRNPDAGLVVFWVKLMQRSYSRSIPGLYCFLKKQGIMAVHPPNPKYVPKTYEQMDHPGQRIQIDVKFVPAVCLVGDAKGQHFYQICHAFIIPKSTNKVTSITIKVRKSNRKLLNLN